MPSADQVPIESPHSTMLRGNWVVLIAGSTGSALRAVRPPNLHITPVVPARSRLYRERNWLLVALALSHHCPGHPGDLIGERDGGDLRRPPRQQCCEPGPMLGAIDLGIADHRQRAGDEQTAQIAIASLADTAEPVLPSARVLLRHDPDPG